LKVGDKAPVIKPVRVDLYRRLLWVYFKTNCNHSRYLVCALCSLCDSEAGFQSNKG